MSCLKISDPTKREEFVKDYLETRKRIRDSQLAEKMGEIKLQTGLSKFFKPITETQKASTKEITEGLKPIKEGIEKFPQQLIPKEEEEEEEVGYSLLDLKYKELKDEYEGDIDRTFGIRRKGINYFIGNKMVDYDGDYIWVGAERYPATDELWELIMTKNPSKYSHSNDDYKNYEKILSDSNVIFRDNDPNNRPKSSRGAKYNIFIKPIYNKIKARGRTGKGIVFIPSDPNALLERLDLLMASKEAGNTGVRNELVSICDELKRQGIFDSNSHKNLMSLL